MRFVIHRQNLRLFTLFNLGRHMSNCRTVLVSDVFDTLSRRRLGNFLSIQEPWKFQQQQQSFRRILATLFRAGETIRVFNTDSRFLDHYVESFEGTNIIYHNKPWIKGTFSNSLQGFKKPDLAIVLSGRSEDLSFMVNEITISQIPIINLSTQIFPTAHAFYTSLTKSNRYLRHFYVQLLLYLLLRYSPQHLLK